MRFTCRGCTAFLPTWSAQCPECAAWNTIRADDSGTSISSPIAGPTLRWGVARQPKEQALSGHARGLLSTPSQPGVSR